jgi:hypothetical protein
MIHKTVTKFFMIVCIAYPLSEVPTAANAQETGAKEDSYRNPPNFLGHFLCIIFKLLQ